MYSAVLLDYISFFDTYSTSGRAPGSMETINIMEISMSYLFIIIMTQ